jgi:lambda repressor-like predicted transcriptional regulator
VCFLHFYVDLVLCIAYFTTKTSIQGLFIPQKYASMGDTSNHAKEEIMATEKIKKMMVDKGLTLKKLAEKAGYSRVHCSNVVHGHFKSPKAREAIARALEANFSEVWQEGAH